MSGPLQRHRRPLPLRIASEPTANVVHAASPVAPEMSTQTTREKVSARPLSAIDIRRHASPAPSSHTSGSSSNMYFALPAGATPTVSHHGTNTVVGSNGLLSPPSTPPTRALAKPDAEADLSSSLSSSSLSPPLLDEDNELSTLDFDVAQSDLIGSGLWSKVYKFRPSTRPRPTLLPDILTPPTTPERPKASSLNHFYAVKVATRLDARDVFAEEARVLSHLQRRTDARKYIIPFHGLILDGTALVLDLATSGDLDSYIQRPLPRDPLRAQADYRSISSQLISGLAFLHSSSVIQADIKPANILLDIDITGSITARYCDFSAAIITSPTNDDLDPSISSSSSKRCGGTWTFMAPEQMTSKRDTNGPSTEADVWALGMTLLTLLLRQSPYADLESQNLFMLREAIKMGDPLSFAMRDPESEKRLLAARAQDPRLLEVLRLALRKKKEERVAAADWAVWAEQHLCDA